MNAFVRGSPYAMSIIVEGERQGPRLHTSSAVGNASSMLSEPTAVPESEPTNLYPVRELKYGKFRREIRLPPGMNVSGILCERSVYGAQN